MRNKRKLKRLLAIAMFSGIPSAKLLSGNTTLSAIVVSVAAVENRKFLESTEYII